MQIEELILVGLGVVSAAAIAHTLGLRRARREELAREAAAARPAAVAAPPAPAKAQPAAEEPEPVSVAPTREAQIAQIAYEEDEEVDPTKVGVGAGVTSKRLRLEPSVQAIVYDEDADIEEHTRSQSLFLVSATAQTDRGMRRKRNEDSLLVSEEENLYVVADGMGGYKGGALASSLAVKTIGEMFSKSADFGAPRKDLPKDGTALARAIQLANDAILDAATKQDLPGMGTTVCAARFSPNKKRLYIGHVGDSRCYRLRGRALKQITADHTMRDFGATGPEAAHLSRAVGVWPAVPIDIIMAEPQAGDVYLLCSDGLTKMVPNDTIASVLQSEEDPKAAVERLVFFANARGGKDNITVILIRVVPPNWVAAPADEASDKPADEASDKLADGADMPADKASDKSTDKPAEA